MPLTSCDRLNKMFSTHKFTVIKLTQGEIASRDDKRNPAKLLEKLNMPQDRSLDILEPQSRGPLLKGRNMMQRRYDNWTFEEHGLMAGDSKIELQRKMTYPTL